ncbi:YTH domain-containing protein, partial [Shewanella algae]|uniref:YTH domain-containing protein n=1 Tax=Shewanella algae TaxID=38313 RepID=UPI00313DAB85
MQSAIGRDLQNTEWVTADGKSTWGGVFRVSWNAIVDVPFNLFHTIRNPLNSNKPVKVSRDGQELPPHIGATVCAIIDQFAKKNP